MDSDIATVLKKKRNIDVLLAVLIVIVYTRSGTTSLVYLIHSFRRPELSSCPGVLPLLRPPYVRYPQQSTSPATRSSVSSGLCPYNRAYALWEGRLAS